MLAQVRPGLWSMTTIMLTRVRPKLRSMTTITLTPYEYMIKKESSPSQGRQDKFCLVGRLLNKYSMMYLNRCPKVRGQGEHPWRAAEHGRYLDVTWGIGDGGVTLELSMP